MSDQDQKTAIPAYVPYKSFSSLIKQLAEQGLPSHIDRSVLSKMSGSQQSSMLGSLLYLKLIEADGSPTEPLKKLVEASSAEYGNLLKTVVISAYKFIFNSGLDLKNTTTKKVEEKFREQGISGSTVSKCIAFFLACCKDAGIEVSKFVKTPPVVTASRTVKRTSMTNRAANAPDEEQEEEEDDETRRQPALPDVHPAIAGLFRELPPAGEPWPKAGRDKFLAAFTAILNFVYPEE